jgi:hypothetical protein
MKPLRLIARRNLPSEGLRPPVPLPPELHWQADANVWHAVKLHFGRRRFLQGLGVALAALAAPLGRIRRAGAAVPGGFFTHQEFITLQALCDQIIPPDHDPGASDLGAPEYIEGLLTAFDGGGVPRIFAGGPFSDRNPFPDYTNGTPSTRFPRNSLKNFLPLSRLEDLDWRAQVFGSVAAGLPSYIDDQAGGPLIGLRDLYRTSLAKVDQVASSVANAPFAALPDDERTLVFQMLDSGAFKPDPRRGGMTFIDVLIEHTIEGCFALPEYGGNVGTRGWQMLGLEGDNQPLGFSVFSFAKGDYNERPDHPMTTPNPDEIGPDGSLRPLPLTAQGTAIEQTIVSLAQALGEDCE